jgi:hypothetical protein
MRDRPGPVGSNRRLPPVESTARTPRDDRSRRVRLGLLAVLAGVPLLALWWMDPVAQDPAYHRFADTRTLWGVPNFWNVASNLPFLVFGLWGLARVAAGRLDPLARAQRPAWAVFFVGAACVALGSSYYHLHPDNASLVWDRLPMTLAFMGLFAALLGEHLGLAWGRRALVPLLLAGLASVAWWACTEARGQGDLRPYAAVQFLPVLLIPALLLAFPRPGRGPLWAVLGTYVLAKALEHWDVAIGAALGGAMAGHALKHLAAGLGIGLLVAWLGGRGRAEPPG